MNISDKVVCIDDRPAWAMDQFSFPSGFVKQGRVYCVRHVSENYRQMNKEGLVQKQLILYLVGCPAIWIQDGIDKGFPASRFRRLEDIKNENKEIEKFVKEVNSKVYKL